MADDITRSEQLDRDLGLGARVVEETQGRFLNRDGSFNVARRGVSWLGSLSLYHALLTMSWPAFFGLITVAYIGVNLLFATAYVLCGPSALEGVTAQTWTGRLGEAFFFSVQTLATVGYGRISPCGLAANVVVSVEALSGLLGFALATGLLFARFSRPEARIVFSRQAVMAPFAGGTALMIRIANLSRSLLVDVRATLVLSRIEVHGGQSVRRFHPLKLERDGVMFLPLHWVIVHPIDEESPLRGADEAKFQKMDAEILLLLTGLEESSSQGVHARYSYKPAEVVWRSRFASIYRPPEAGHAVVDLGRLHDIEPVE